MKTYEWRIEILNKDYVDSLLLAFVKHGFTTYLNIDDNLICVILSQGNIKSFGETMVDIEIFTDLHEIDDLVIGLIRQGFDITIRESFLSTYELTLNIIEIKREMYNV